MSRSSGGPSLIIGEAKASADEGKSTHARLLLSQEWRLLQRDYRLEVQRDSMMHIATIALRIAVWYSRKSRSRFLRELHGKSKYR